MPVMNQNGTGPSQASLRKGLSRDEMKALTDRILGFAKADQTRVTIRSGVSGFTRTAMNRITTAGSTTDVSCESRARSANAWRRWTRTGSTIARSNRRCATASRWPACHPRIRSTCPNCPQQSYVEVNGYYPSTGDLTNEDRSRAASLVLERSKGAGTVAAGFIDLFAGSQAVANRQGSLPITPRRA